MQRPSLAWWAVVTAGVALIIGIVFFYNPGADDDGGSSADPTSEPSQPALPKPTQPAAPTLPAAARQQTAEGAEAFARYHFTLFNHAQKYNDSTELKNFSAPNCNDCAITASVLDDRKAKNIRAVGGEWSVKKTFNMQLSPLTFKVTLILDRAAVEELTPEGNPVSPRQEALHQEILSLQVTWLGSSWKLVSIA